MITFEKIIEKLEKYWSSKGCAVLQSCDNEVGAATLNHFTSLRALDSKNWNICQAQFCRRPKDARFAENPNRLGGYYQFQVIMKPIPSDIQEFCIESLSVIGIDKKLHDFRFVEDNWANPSIGASGLGYEVWCNNMEVVQFTYMQQIGGFKCKKNPVELTYGLERVAMYIQNVDNIFDIQWNESLKYSDIHKKDFEISYSEYYQNFSEDTEFLLYCFNNFLKNGNDLIEKSLLIPAYEYCLKASHYLNILDARGVLSQNERASYLLKIRDLVKLCCNEYILKYGDSVN